MFILTVLLGIKFHSEKVELFLFCAAQTKLECTGRSGHQLKRGHVPRRHTYYMRQGLGRLVCDG